MSQQELLRKVVETLESAQIDYMITGSVVSSLQGEPRATHDIDVVIAIQTASIPRLLAAFPSPDKVDFWPLTNDDFDQSRFHRRYTEDFLGLKMKVTRAEDTILMKLRWAKQSGGSEKQFIDALRVYEVQFKNLDLVYINRWTKDLAIETEWLRLQKEAQVIE